MRSKNDEAIAATAGVDNWKTWAGRSHGSNNFEALDLFRGARRKFNKRFRWTKPVSGTDCPICLCERDEWHVTSSCGHAVCLECFKAYATSQVDDKDHRGPLKCPVCSLPLRPKDAVVAISDEKNTVRKWDEKIRDDVLRALPSFRYCPHCENSQNNPSYLKGGGFVTSECLQPINENRERRAEVWLSFIVVVDMLFVGIYFVCIFMYNAYSTSAIACLLSPIALLRMMTAVSVVCKRSMAREARRALFRTISVECPCCDKEFVLNAEAETSSSSGELGDEESKKWIGQNTRPCPSCSVPISKISGCNHMRCAHCRANFCWACMRLRAQCNPYRCKNGAPYGNASPLKSVSLNDADDSIRGKIRTIEDRRVRLHGVEIVMYFWLFISILPYADMLKFFTTTPLIVYTTLYLYNPRRAHINSNYDNEQNQLRATREDEMLATAIARSIQEQ